MTTYRTGNHTPDYAHGARDALALVADRIADAAEGFTPHALGTLGDILEGVAAELGVDEDVPQCPERGIGDHDCAQHTPPSPLSAPVTAQEPPTVGQDRPDAHSGFQARTVECKLARPAGPGPTDPCDCFVWQPCAMQHPRAPERKADQHTVADSCTCTIAGPDPACVVHHGRRAKGPKPPNPPGCICDGSGRACPRHGAVI